MPRRPQATSRCGRLPRGVAPVALSAAILMAFALALWVILSPAPGAAIITSDDLAPVKVDAEGRAVEYPGVRRLERQAPGDPFSFEIDVGALQKAAERGREGSPTSR